MVVGKIAVPLVSILMVVGVIIGIVVVVQSNHHAAAVHEVPMVNNSMKMVTSICELTDYKEACAKSLESAAKNASSTGVDYIMAVVQATLKEVKKSLAATGKVVVDKSKDEYNYVAVEDCKDLLDYAVDTLQASISLIGDNDLHMVEDREHELLSWMTAVYAFQTTCMDNIESPEYRSAVQNGMVNATQLTHNAVNIMAELSKVLSLFEPQKASSRRRLMLSNDGFPDWFAASDRKLLAANEVKPNVAVAKDGSGQFKTIKQAIESYPSKFKGRYIIYVKAGVYNEQVIIDKKKPNIYMYGDGIGKTIVTGAKNFAKQKIGTMHTATFANEAEGFIARAMTFRNEAGPEGHQAVAFRSQGDRAALFDCSFEGSQDTLYYQSMRQFYRNCHIYGTVDFIFGKGDCVIQDSEIIVRKPMPKQFNTVTADGKEIPKGSNGLVIQNCRIVPDKYLFPTRFQIPTYLGRPWTPQALTVVMQSELGDFIRPEGWRLWDGSDNQMTCEMYEFANRGPGARTDGRDKAFAHFKVLDSAQAAKYAPGPFLAGQQWLPQTGVPFRLGL